MAHLPRLLITLGDVSGIGPEIVARAWPQLLPLCRPTVVGDPGWLQRGLQLVDGQAKVIPITDLKRADPAPDRIPCLLATEQDLSSVQPGTVTAAAGRAAYDFL